MFICVNLMIYFALIVGMALSSPTKSLGEKNTTYYMGHALYVNPLSQKSFEKSIKVAEKGIEKDNLIKMKDIASAYWLNLKSKVQPENNTTTTVEGILKNSLSMKPASLVTFVLHNLPNRECHKKYSNSEISCSSRKNADSACGILIEAGGCTEGLNDYKKNFINPIAHSIRKYCSRVPMVFVIEPHSLVYLATESGNENCRSAAVRTSYTEGVRYAVNKLAESCSKAIIYVDASHDGWLDQDKNRKNFADIIQNLHIKGKIRGFSLNVGKYQPLGQPCPRLNSCQKGRNNEEQECCKNRCEMPVNSNLGYGTLNFAAQLRNTMDGINFDAKMIIDTSRNGRDTHTKCKSWCNIRNAGSGHWPTTDTDLPDIIDAYMWLKTPGESDGCTKFLPSENKCLRHDESCSSKDSIGSGPGEPRAPETGRWFDYHARMLARNAEFGS